MHPIDRAECELQSAATPPKGARGIYEFVISHRYVAAFVIYATVAALYAVATDGVLRDDAYIFFTYARNLSESGSLAFNPGEPSYGVTSILWTLLVAAGTYIAQDPVAVAKILGVILGAAGAVLWAKWMYDAASRPLSLRAVAIAALWPTIGADRMVTGMETGLQCALSGAVIVSVTSKHRARHFVAGVLLGLLVLTRPELIFALCAAVAFVAIRENLVSASKVLVTAVVICAWWPIWLYTRTGSLLPPTRFGKMAVFLPEQLDVTLADYEMGNVGQRVAWAWDALSHFAVSGVSSAVLISLVALACAVAIWGLSARSTERLWQLTLPHAAIVCLILLYCLTFPLLQLRYFVWLVPALVFSIHASLARLLRLRVMTVVLTAVVLLFTAALPVALARRIESTKVQHLRRAVAKAVNQVTPPGSRVALEPIGEVGYYSHRYIVDMGGIIDTRIQPHLLHGYADVNSVWNCLEEQKADYLVTYDHDGFLGRLPRTHPERFEHMLYIPEEPFRGTRYSLWRIVREHTGR